MAIFSKPARSSTPGSTKSQEPPRPPLRRALILAMTYKSVGVGGPEELRTPHKDARDWRMLLIDKYQFREDDITMMLDDGDTPPHLFPTKENILQQMSLLIEGARAGDKFMFYYSGHSDQLPSLSIHEEDGMDEAMVTYPSTPHMMPILIVDNELRERLVDPLPVGAMLTAIFDSCHSGTLLDLDHYHCNTVYFPWVNKGTRDAGAQPRAGVLRQNGMDAKHQYDGLLHAEPVQNDSASETTTVVYTEEPPRPKVKQSVRIYERKRTGENRMFKRNTTVNDVAPKKAEHRRLVIRSSTMDVPLERRDSLEEARKPKRSSTLGVFKGFAEAVVEHTIRPFRSASPESYLPCNGWCKPLLRRTKAHVVSIAAAQDPQRTWESRRGRTVTQSLISTLKQDPHLPYRKLINIVGHDLHKNTTLRLHRWGQAKIKDWHAAGSPPDLKPDVETVNGSEPALGTMEPMAEDERFVL